MTFQPDGLVTVGAIRINAVADYVSALRGRRTASEYGGPADTANQVTYRCTLAANNTTAMCATSMDIQCHDLLFTLVGKRPRGPSAATLATPLQSEPMQVMSVLTGHVPSQSLPGTAVSPLEFRATIAGSLRFAGVATRDVSLSTDGSLGKSSTHIAVNTSGLVTIFANECVMTGQEVLVDLPFPSSYYHSLKSEDNRYDEKWKEWRDKAAASVCASPGKPFRDTLRVMAASDDNLRATVPRKEHFRFRGDGCEEDKEKTRNQAFGGPWIIGRCVRGNMQAGQKIDVCLYDAPRVAHCCDDDEDAEERYNYDAEFEHQLVRYRHLLQNASDKHIDKLNELHKALLAEFKQREQAAVTLWNTQKEMTEKARQDEELAAWNATMLAAVEDDKEYRRRVYGLLQTLCKAPAEAAPENPTSRAHRLISEFLLMHGIFEVQQVRGDGTCFFYALATHTKSPETWKMPFENNDEAYTTLQIMGSELRSDVVAYINTVGAKPVLLGNNSWPDEFLGVAGYIELENMSSNEDYVTYLKNPNNFAEDCCLAWTVQALKHNPKLNRQFGVGDKEVLLVVLNNNSFPDKETGLVNQESISMNVVSSSNGLPASADDLLNNYVVLPVFLLVIHYRAIFSMSPL